MTQLAASNGRASLPRTCVIGAGASGLAACKALSDRGIPFECFDRGDSVGGLWVLDSASGVASAYRNLHINVSRERMEFRDFPIPKSYPTYLHHTQIVRYWNDFTRAFGLDRHIRLNTGVEAVRRTPQGVWEVTLEGGERHLYDAVVVANGHHSDPRMADLPGRFDGVQIHSRDYRDDSQLRDRDVLVIGLGNSAMDVAVESSYAARSTYLSARRGAHILPKHMFGYPYDQVPGLEYMLGRGIGPARLRLQMPWLARQLMLEFGVRLSSGRMEDHGLPKPRHRFGAVHPTISSRLLDRIAHGRIAPKPGVERLDGDRVRFVDGTEARVDTIVHCTGYRIAFPFLPPELVPVADNRVDLYWNVFPPGVPGLAFLGVVQPASGSTMQIAETQGKWVAAHLAGEYALPPEGQMRAAIERARRRSRRRYVQSARHTVQLEQFEFEWRLPDELRRGRRRARAAGPPVQARAAALELREPAAA